MTVVLSYHRIVEREPAEVDSRWKSYTAILLLVIVASCLVLSFSLHGLLVDFKYNCLLDANLKFNLKANQTFGDGSNNPTISPFSNYTIDEYWSSWSDGAYCETLKYVPLLQGISSTIWLALFLIHGPGRIMPQPWRIVFPSLIYFFGCLVTSAVTASFITQGLAKFCTEFWQVDTKRDYSCAQYVVFFALTKEPSALVQGDKNFLLSLVFPWIWVGATCLGFLILLLRIVLMVDFQLMRVDILRHQS